MIVNAKRMLVVVMGGWLSGFTANAQYLPNLFPFPNATGVLETDNVANQPIDLTGPFFQSLGTNGRSCASCHRPAQGWTISADEVRFRFEVTQGLDPIFRTNDGSNCNHNIDTSTVAGRRQAYSLLINKGLIRIALAVPPTAEFNVISVVNRYGCGDQSMLSIYRGPPAIHESPIPQHSHVGWAGILHADWHPKNYVRHESGRFARGFGPPIAGCD
jgi:hypothetical protein